MSARRRQLILAPLARQDLADLLLYTEQRWGKRQRNSYKAALDQAMRKLTRFPNMGRPRDDISLGLRVQPVREHVIYYRTSDQDVRIVRILHGRMDAAGQVGEP